MNAVDTNVLVYSYDERDTKRRDIARRVIDDLTNGVLLWQVACEFIAASRKLAQAGLSADTAWQRLDEIAGWLSLVTPTPGVFVRARALHAQQQVQFWDAMILAACQEAGVSTLYSEDVPGSVVPAVRVVNPFAG